MSTNGGPAFPTSNGGSPDDGMTLRDYFAAKIAAAIWCNSEVLKQTPNSQEAHAIALISYEQADAMLKARNE